MSYDSLRKTAEYFEDRARRARPLDKRERLAAVAKKYRLRAENQRKLDIQSARNEGSKIERQTPLAARQARPAPSQDAPP